LAWCPALQSAPQLARGRASWRDAHAGEARRLDAEVGRLGLPAEQRLLDALLGGARAARSC